MERRWILLSGNNKKLVKYGYMYNFYAVQDYTKYGYLYNWYTTQNAVKYGYLYNWYVTQGTGNTSVTSSDEWGIPTYNTNSLTDFGTLDTVLSTNTGDKLKTTGTSEWSTGNNGTNITNFSARPSLYRYSDGSFFAGGSVFYAWTKTLYSGSLSVIYRLVYNSSNLLTTVEDKKTGCSIRLVRQATTEEQTYSDGTYCTPYIGNDGRQYKTVKIGTQVWLAENLAETKFRDGSSIANVTDNTAWSNLTTPALCAYNNDISNFFYTPILPSAMESAGWRIPTWYDCNNLSIYVGGELIAGEKLKESGINYWTQNNGTNNYSFNWKGSGIRNGVTGAFQKLQLESFIWTNEVQSPSSSYVYNTASGATYAALTSTLNSNGCSIRLVRNATPQELLLSDGTYIADRYVGNDYRAYNSVKIGDKIWLSDNLAETMFRDGTYIQNITDNSQWTTLSNPAMCSYNNDYTISFKNELIPFNMELIGWKVPSISDTQSLWSSVGGYNMAGKKLKSNSQLYWVDYQNNTNIYGLDIRGSGNRYGDNGYFVNIQNAGEFWNIDNFPSGTLGINKSTNFSSYYDSIGYNNRVDTFGNSVRLVRPATTQELQLQDGTKCDPYIGNDGFEYPTVKIGPQVWISVNLAETKLRDGTTIPIVSSNSAWIYLNSKAMCAYNNDISNVFI